MSIRLKSGQFRSRKSRSRLFHPLVVLTVILSGIPELLAGEPQWIEVRSPNFSVVTDAGEKRGREVAMRFEQMRAVFGSLMTKAKVNLPVPLQIVAFRNSREMRQVAPLFNGKPTEVAGLFQEGTDRTFIMLDMSVENPWVVVFHEYAHQLMNGNLKGEFAPWFEEGFAEYFSTIEVDGKQARVGKIPVDEYIILHSGTMKITDLFRVQQNSQTYNESGDHRNVFYAESGMLMHYIYDNKLMPKVGIYFDLMDKRTPIEDAIQQAFGMSSAQFDKALRSYIASGTYKYYPIPTPASITSASYTARPLSTGDGNAVLAEIHLYSHDRQQQALGEFQQILKSDPNNAAACRGMGYAYLQKQDFPQAAEYFHRASKLDSTDARVHYYSALLMARESGYSASDVPAMTTELEAAITLDPAFADPYALLAFAQSTSGDSAKALITMQKALAISPRNENYLFNLANIYLANRQPDQAIAVLQALRITHNPELAARVTETLSLARQFRDMGGPRVAASPGVLLSRPDDSAVPVDPQSTSHMSVDAPVVDVPAIDVPKKAQTNAGASPKFVRGVLTHVDCATAPSATLTLVSGSQTLKLQVRDTSNVILIGAQQFSCSWQKKKVAINYRENDGQLSVLSLEIQ